MPWNKVMKKFGAGELHSGSKHGPKVTSQKQAVAIMLSEKRAAAAGKSEYAADSGEVKKKRKAAEFRLGKGAHCASKH